MHNHLKISAIVAMAENGVIGKNNQIPWHLPVDLKHFKTLTTGHTIVMGRKTHESIGKPLPQRTNIVLTRQKDFQAPGCIVLPTIIATLEWANANQNQEIFIIGGAEIYQQWLPFIRKMYLTIVNAQIMGDTYFPTFDRRLWQEVERQDLLADDNNMYNFSFITLVKK